MEMLVGFGGAVKALGNGVVAGYLVTYGSPEQTDIEGEFFAADTDYDLPAEAAVKISAYYNHGLDPTLRKKRLGKAEVKTDEVGIWAELQLDIADAYQAAIYGLTKAGKMGWSSGAPPHLVDKEKSGGAVKLTMWPVVEASLTPKPAEPRNIAVALKSLQDGPSLEELIASEGAESSPVAPATKTLSLGDAASADFQVHSAAVASAAEEFAARSERRLEARIKAGRVLSAANVQEIEAVRDSLSGLIERLSAVLERAQPQSPSDEEAQKSARRETERLRTHWLRLQSHVAPASLSA